MKGKPVATKSVSEVPDKPISQYTYWEIIAEIDATIFCIEQLAGSLVKRPPIVQMIDESTGYDKEQADTLEYWSHRLRELMAFLPADDPHLVKPELPQRLIEQPLAKKRPASKLQKPKTRPSVTGDNK